MRESPSYWTDFLKNGLHGGEISAVTDGFTQYVFKKKEKKTVEKMFRLAVRRLAFRASHRDRLCGRRATEC